MTDSIKTRKPADRRGTTTSSRDGGIRKKRHVRFSDAEWAYLLARAKKARKTASAFIRAIGLEGMSAENPSGYYSD